MGFFEKLREKRNRVETIEVSEKRPMLRLVIVLALLAIGFTAIAFGLINLLNKDNGWRAIEMSESLPEVESELVFNYCLGKSGSNATAEYKAISALYSQEGKRAYQLLHSTNQFDGVNNLATLSANPNQEFKVDPLLYNSLKTVTESENRLVYYAPIYLEYEAICTSSEPHFAELRDPLRNGEAAEYVKQLVNYANNPQMVNLQFMGDNCIKLSVSDEYLAFASENEISCFLDFGWLKNAFIVDAIADACVENGYTYGNITSFDGFTRNFDNSGESYSYNLFDLRADNKIYPAAVLSYSGNASFVTFRGYPMTEKDNFDYYSYSDGSIVTPYVGADGLYSSGCQDLLTASKNFGCAQLALKSYGSFLNSGFSTAEAKSLMSQKITSFWIEGDVVYHTGDDFSVGNPFSENGITYFIEAK